MYWQTYGIVVVSSMASCISVIIKCTSFIAFQHLGDCMNFKTYQDVYLGCLMTPISYHSHTLRVLPKVFGHFNIGLVLLKASSTLALRGLQDVYCGCLMTPISYRSAAQIVRIQPINKYVSTIFFSILGHPLQVIPEAG